MPTRNVDEIIQRMKGAIGVNEDKELRQHLNLRASGLISNWRKLKSIPYIHIDRLVLETGRSFDWFLTGETPTSITEPITECFPDGKYPTDLQYIIDSWSYFDPVEKTAVMGVVNTFGKHEMLSLKINDSKG